MGNIAQQVLTHGTHPVLVVHPDAAPDPLTLSHLAVPLDGTSRHEHSLPVPWALAGACGAVVHLVTVVPTLAELNLQQGAPGRMLPLTTAARLDIEEQQAERYLRHRACSAPA